MDAAIGHAGPDAIGRPDAGPDAHSDRPTDGRTFHCDADPAPSDSDAGACCHGPARTGDALAGAGPAQFGSVAGRACRL